LMMYIEEFGIITLPRPTPTSSVRDLLMPAPAVFGACVLSINCACALSPIKSAPAVSARSLPGYLIQPPPSCSGLYTPPETPRSGPCLLEKAETADKTRHGKQESVVRNQPARWEEEPRRRRACKSFNGFRYWFPISWCETIALAAASERACALSDSPRSR